MQDTVQFTLIYKWLFTLLYIHIQSDLVNANLVSPFKMQIKKCKWRNLKLCDNRLVIIQKSLMLRWPKKLGMISQIWLQKWEEKNSHYSALQKQPGHYGLLTWCYLCKNAVTNNPFYIYNIGLTTVRIINFGIHALSLT